MLLIGAVSTADTIKTATSTASVTSKAVTVATSRVGRWSFAKGFECYGDVAHIGECNVFRFMQCR